jgi:hypothetical protein
MEKSGFIFYSLCPFFFWLPLVIGKVHPFYMKVVQRNPIELHHLKPKGQQHAHIGQEQPDRRRQKSCR